MKELKDLFNVFSLLDVPWTALSFSHVQSCNLILELRIIVSGRIYKKPDTKGKLWGLVCPWIIIDRAKFGAESLDVSTLFYMFNSLPFLDLIPVLFF